MASIGSGVEAYVTTQIEKRQDRHGSRSISKSTAELLNSNTAFVRLRSSVNEISPGEYQQLEKGETAPISIKGTQTKAKNSTLSGGTLNASGKPRQGVDLRSDQNTVSVSAAYHNSATLGFRPMPGITSATIKSKGDGGTLQEAEVSFNVWSKEDLNTFELCYFRVGYSALLEYGHTVYVDNSGQVQTITESQLISNDDWFKNSNSKTIEGKIASIRETSVGNYDAIFGFIKNFSWKLRNDGGYDCSVSIISKGAVINALKAGKTTDHTTPEEQIGPEDSEKTKDESRSIFHFIFYRLDKQREETRFKMNEFLSAKKAKSISSKIRNTELFRTSMTIGKFTNMILKLLNDHINLTYMPFGTFLEIVNAFCMLKDQDGKNVAEFDPGSEETFRTFDGHFSVDPLVAVPPKKPTGDYSFCNIEKDGLHNDMQAYANSNGGTDLIRNIMVSTHFLRSKVEEFTDGPVEEGAGLLELVKNVLTGMQNALGEINDFNVIWTEVEPGFWYYSVIDGRMPALAEKRRNIPTITINGLSTTVSDVSVNSKISSEMASMVSIAAQGSTGNYSDNLNNILRFNAGALDRHYLLKAQSPDDKNNDLQNLQDKKKQFNEDLKLVWKNFNEEEAIDPDLWNQVRQECIGIMNLNTKSEYSKKNIPDPMPVPIQLSLKLKGISGFKQLSTFKVNSTLLPDKYQKFAYIIHGIEQSIDNSGKWTTSLTAKMFNV